MKTFNSLLYRLSRNRLLLSLQDASVSLLPIILAVTFVLLLSHALALLPYSSKSDFLISGAENLFNFFYVIFPLLFSVSLSTSLARSYEVDPVIINIICTSLLLLTSIDKSVNYESLESNLYFQLLPIPINISVIKIYTYLLIKKKLLIYRAGDFGIGLRRHINSILPAIAALGVVYGAIFLIKKVDSHFSLTSSLYRLSPEAVDSLPSYLIEKMVRGLCWFIGINPNYPLDFLREPVKEGLLRNSLAVSQGQDPTHIITYNFHLFSDIGGAGSVFCLMLATFFVSTSKHNRKVAKLSAVPSTFNISEVIHYGLPIVFNPFLFLPFIFVPIISGLITYFAMWIGWVSPISNSIPWLVPPLINTYLSTGEIAAVLVQAFNLVVGTLIYIPFLKASEKSNLDRASVKAVSQTLRLESKNIQSLYYRNQKAIIDNLHFQKEIDQAFWDITHGTLLLNYQPILNVRSGKVEKIEALIRLKQEDDSLKGPYFIDLLSKVGLSTDFDKWVLKRVVKQSNEWEDLMPGMTISINVSPESLRSSDFVNFFIEQASQMQHALSLEILETSMIFEYDEINEHLSILRNEGIEVYMDDFGSGFSGLSMLPNLMLDGVKFDLSFAPQMSSERGIQFLRSCVAINRTLRHQIIFEGIETEEQLNTVNRLGIDLVQGYYISKPLSPQDVCRFVCESNC
ncbi:PTS sugar transporter subunit IIC/EAL domain-containing protein [Pseudoteredinibacter isoporae]|uniref:Lactose/cellobiose-specific phosphotransferase system IIC component n=2 Tax=Pseudoteredinibacter isoporae TaxID=570281 RepID=A0A7X0JVI0_9GAMM|nr:EAL domain-containing protein [Pseudoteredinibacter isoporae]MBB6523017.1 lactose/cellobiose-specific phosphotransferase system IIC component [Pseudoteredinibacter isoporae]NHO88539.1 PTS sugar transporter subunit IIC/EAL domain-containing protein [Pseudoteredinibacter isoporae]NIB22770.1 PTS sugar transporter subunit IIC/EAL domain-containing protein [Pseudoteredinibacter isoporae]